MDNQYNFFYDESEHSRKINHSTVSSHNYYDNFVTVIVGWNSKKHEYFEQKYKVFEEKYEDRKSEGELKSKTIRNKQIRFGFASLNRQNIEFISDFFSLFDENVHVQFTVISKIEYVINQLFQEYRSNFFCNMDSMKYSLIKSIITYKPLEVINAIFNKPKELVKLLKEFLQERISINKSNLPLKEKENLAFNNIIDILNDINENINIEWDYSTAFSGFMYYLNENEIDKYSLIIDAEGDESNTLNGARNVGLINVAEKDSKDCFGVRWADLLVGIISKLIKSLHSSLRYTSSEENKGKKLLDPQWFDVNEKQLELYKKLNYIILSLNNSWFKSYAGTYNDDMTLFITFSDYISIFESIEELNETDKLMHAEYYNAGVCSVLADYFKKLEMKESNLKSKLPIDVIHETNEEFFYGRRGQKIYFDEEKQPKIELNEGEQVIEVLSVGVSKNNRPSVTINDAGTAKCYMLPEELFDWAITCVSLSNQGLNVFPSKVVFTRQRSEYYVDIL